MPEFPESTLWRISAFERMRDRPDAPAQIGVGSTTMLSTTLLAELRQLRLDPDANDVLETMAACVRNREAALLYLAVAPYVWPVTLFPQQFVYHSPRDVADLSAMTALSKLKVISVEVPGVRPPGHRLHERIAANDRYRPLAPLFWAVAMHGARAGLLAEIGGHAAYRVIPGPAHPLPVPTGALAPAMQRLRQGAASLREMAHWPGMSVERASRLLNALYLCGALMVTRSHPAARSAPTAWRDLFSRRR